MGSIGISRVILFPYQKESIDRLASGSILCGGVGSGKSITSLAYYYMKECNGFIGDDGKLSSPRTPKDLYIITTARKRDTFEWEEECLRFGISSDPDKSNYAIKVIIDSWNNIGKYEKVLDCMFIFDEQRVVGSGSWVKSFLRIAKANSWLLLSATPGDTWMDYIPVFVANGFYKNRTAFLARHAIYNRFTKFPKVDRFVDCGHLEALRRRITVMMDYKKDTIPHFLDLKVQYDAKLFRRVSVDRWNIYDSSPIQDIAGVCYLMRKVVNSDPSRIETVREIMHQHPKIIVFYNFDYELELLKGLKSECRIAEWNGHRHEAIPKTDRWIYLVQYTAGAEGWNCIETDVIVFYSQNYSYKIMTQAAGRIDRLNTPYTDLYYYTLKSDSYIDKAIELALDNKQTFNENLFIRDSKFA